VKPEFHERKKWNIKMMGQNIIKKKIKKACKAETSKEKNT
jgi:hypothetical protein